MTLETDSFPDAESLWRGCILASIMHAVSTTAFPELAYEHSWDGPNYSVNNSSGTRGTVTFVDTTFVAVFRDEHSAELFMVPDDVASCPLFHGAPKQVIDLARAEALQYVLDEDRGMVAPMITAAFWGINGETSAAVPWSLVVQQGAHVISTQCLPLDNQASIWREAFSLDEHLARLADRLFEQRIAVRSQRIGIPGADLLLLRQRCESPKAWQETTTSLMEIGFEVSRR